MAGKCTKCGGTGHNARTCSVQKRPRTSGATAEDLKRHGIEWEGAGPAALAAAQEIHALVEHCVEEGLQVHERAGHQQISEQLSTLAAAVKDLREGLLRKCAEVRKLEKAGAGQVDEKELARLDRR